jgi:hypothetical protein
MRGEVEAGAQAKASVPSKPKYRKQPHAKERGAADMDALIDPCEKHFDTSGKSPG